MTNLLAELLRRARTPATIRLLLPWHDWIRGLAARHARVVAGPPAPEMVLARLLTRRTLGFARTLSQRVDVQVRAALPVRRSPPGVRAPRDQRTNRATHTVVYVSEGRADARLHRPMSPLGASRETRHDLVRRIVDERRRVEAPMHATPATLWPHPFTGALTPGARFSLPQSGGASGGAYLAPPELTLARSPRSGARADVVPADIATPLPRSEQVRRDAPAAQLDLDRLTDQVVRKIDRRIVAERERVGRF
jgi:hypothetical protein